MSPEERRKGAFEELEELLLGGAEINQAISKAASDNELKPEVLRAFAEKHLGDLDAYASKMRLRMVNAAIDAEVKLAASKRHPRNAFDDCFDLGEVAAKVEHRIRGPITDAEVLRIEEAYKHFILARIKSLVGE